ncbi:hypothetical protein SAMN05443637_10758 [Pseudonocardia thermophila]|jgi:hypothetical protein|uniref:Uncharacterized protein n=1 Tax=Pseudonocardia thermophila TaxID=1848 RepID=A0A1M6SZT4_PSETH|nr:hypothetical protein [Pseudonocardia thermophila]SHK50139.1 hypothetical protein SAMN05443637_10758 [Pseudonocardia thermophila]
MFDRLRALFGRPRPPEDVRPDAHTARSRETGGTDTDSTDTDGTDTDSTEFGSTDSAATTGTGRSEGFVGRVAGQDEGFAGETGAEARGDR